jgi:sec-independent protein translocase protein TatA
MFGLRLPELILIFVVVLLLFGGTKLPQLGSSLGQAIRNFKRGFGGEPEAQGDTPRQDALETGTPEAGKTGTRSPASASKDA